MCAVLDRLSRRTSFIANIFTSIPESIFAQSLRNYKYHNVLTDIGLVQKDAFTTDIEATCQQLTTLLPFDNTLVGNLAQQCRKMSFIICDISPLGIAVARQLGIPSVLIENFTWDWLYNFYRDEFPQIGYFADYFQELFSQADYHIQTEPLCNPAKADLHCGPIFRKIKENPESIKSIFQCGERKITLVTMGGISFFPSFLDSLKGYGDFFFIFGGQEKSGRIGDNIHLLDRITDHYHPDLINCADIVVFKSGYSTLAECFQAATASICVQRDGFAESKVIENFAKQHLRSTIIKQEDFTSGQWLKLLPDTVPYQQSSIRENGADVVAEFLLSLTRPQILDKVPPS